MSKFILVNNIGISDATDEGMITITLDREDGESLEYDFHCIEAVEVIIAIREKIENWKPIKEIAKLPRNQSE